MGELGCPGTGWKSPLYSPSTISALVAHGNSQSRSIHSRMFGISRVLSLITFTLSRSLLRWLQVIRFCLEATAERCGPYQLYLARWRGAFRFGIQAVRESGHALPSTTTVYSVEHTIATFTVSL